MGVYWGEPTGMWTRDRLPLPEKLAEFCVAGDGSPVKGYAAIPFNAFHLPITRALRNLSTRTPWETDLYDQSETVTSIVAPDSRTVASRSSQ